MFHYRLMELEAELLAKEESQRGLAKAPLECLHLLEFIEKQVGLKLGDRVSESWKGWLTYKREKDSLIILRGRAFSAGFFGGFKAGLDVTYGHDTITEYERHFDVTPPPELDYLMINFGALEKIRVFLWYGENMAAHKLIYSAEVADDPHKELSDAVVECCTWILKRPKGITLSDFLKEVESKEKG